MSDNLPPEVRAALDAAAELRKWGVVLDDDRMDYLEVQVDRESVRRFDEAMRRCRPSQTGGNGVDPRG